jgi:hypothetical protein
VWPSSERILYTNDERPVFFKKYNLRSFLAEELGVTVIPLEFKRFKTTGSLCKIFRNNFYKHEVLGELANRNAKFAILADCDSIWLRQPCSTDFSQSPPDALHLVEVRPRASVTEEFQGVSRAGMGAIFRAIDPLYPEAFPRWYGSELIAGSSKRLLQFYHDLKHAYDLFRKHPKSADFQLGDSGILENDEWLLSFVVQGQGYHVCDVRHWFDRVWTGHEGHPSSEHLKLFGLHLLAEKNLGFRAIFEDVLHRQSEFWRGSLDRFPLYLGGYFGIPDRMQWPNYSAGERAIQWSVRAWRRLRLPIAPTHQLAQLVRKITARI